MTRLQKQFLSWFLIIPLILLINFTLNRFQALFFMNSLTSLIFGTLILVWGRITRSRIIHTQTRHCLTGVSWALFALYLLRICRWEFFYHDDVPDRLCWYLYYLVFIAVPLLSYHAALGISLQQTKACQYTLYAAWITGILLVLGTMTNELHGQLLEIRADGSTKHRWMYYALVIWSVLLSVGVLFVLIRRCRLSACRKHLYIPVCMSAAGMLLLTWYNLNGGSPKLFHTKLFYMHEAYSLIFIGLWEGCILIGLLPSNTGYQQLFTHSHINAVLKDAGNSVWYSSIQVETGSNPDDLVTHTKPLTSGSITWSEDVHTIRRLREELAEANSSLEEENDLIEEENRITAERTQYETQNRLYDRIAEHTRRQLAEIAESFTDTDTFTAQLHKNLLLGTYVKRCANLMLLADANSRLSTDELMLALRETLDTLRFSGIDCVLQSGTARQYPAEMLVAAYDLAQAAAELTRSSCSVFCATVVPDVNTVLLLETDAAISADALGSQPPESSLTVSVTESDGTYRLRIGGAPYD